MSLFQAKQAAQQQQTLHDTTGTHCNVLQRTLQRTATHCNTLQHALQQHVNCEVSCATDVA